MKRQRILAAVGFLLMLPVLCLPAFAAQTQGTLQLCCSVSVNGERQYFAGDEFSIVKIADAVLSVQEGTPMLRYMPLDGYEKPVAQLAGLSTQQLREQAKKMAAAAAKSGAYTASAVTDAHGGVTFDGLDAGLYLVVRTKAGLQNEAYLSDPFLASVPMIVENEIFYTVTAFPKYGWLPEAPEYPEMPPVTPQTPMLPQTGQLKWPVPVLMLLGSALILIGLRKNRQTAETK